jgi:hypothetical protein
MLHGGLDKGQNFKIIPFKSVPVIDEMTEEYTIRNQEPYSQHSIFFLTYKWVQ